MAQNATDQKKQIVVDLQAIIQPNGPLKSVVVLDHVKDLFEIEYPQGLPAVVVCPPEITQSVKEDSAHNTRTYQWDMFIVLDDLAIITPYDVEACIDAVLNAFDNDETLNGNSWPAVDPAVGKTLTSSSGDKTYDIVPVTIKARALIAITP